MHFHAFDTHLSVFGYFAKSTLCFEFEHVFSEIAGWRQEGDHPF
jgi:hypothetical protein